MALIILIYIQNYLFKNAKYAQLSQFIDVGRLPLSVITDWFNFKTKLLSIMMLGFISLFYAKLKVNKNNKTIKLSLINKTSCLFPKRGSIATFIFAWKQYGQNFETARWYLEAALQFLSSLKCRKYVNEFLN